MEEIVTLASICNGAALELFQKELQAVIANIADPNTSPTAKREINIKVKILPDKVRGMGVISLEVTSKIAGVDPVSGAVYFGRKGDEFVATQNNHQQPSIFDEPGQKSNIQPMHAVAGGKRE